MGNNISNQNLIENSMKNESCLICWENIGSQKWSKCFECHIVLHKLCEETYRGEKRIL
jgi:hypothetical protein